MKRGEVWWINFGATSGGEIKKVRPAVIISNDIANKYLNRVQVVPLSTNVQNIYPSEAKVTVNGKLQKTMADQLTTVSKRRVINKEGKLSPIDLRAVENVVKVQLGL